MANGGRPAFVGVLLEVTEMVVTLVVVGVCLLAARISRLLHFFTVLTTMPFFWADEDDVRLSVLTDTVLGRLDVGTVDVCTATSVTTASALLNTSILLAL